MIISSFCNFGNCVAVAQRGAEVAVWCTRRPDDEVSFTAAEWSAFVAGVKAGEFDLSTGVTGPDSAAEPRAAQLSTPGQT